MAFKILNQKAKLRSIEEIKKRFSHAETIKRQWEPLLRAVYEYFLPNRNLYYYSSQNQGQLKTDRVFDSTAQIAITRGANRVQSTLMPPFAKWAGLQAGPMVPEDKKSELNAELEEVERKLFAVIHASNFDTAINEVLLELFIGTACLLTMPGDFDQPVMYIPVPLQQVYLEEGPWGSVGGNFRKHKMLISNIMQQWPDITALPEILTEKASKNPGAEVEILEYTYPSTTTKKGEKCWVYDLICTDVNNKDDTRLLSRLYTRNPWITPRWLKVAGEVYGRGPAIFALPDVKTQNKVVELILRNAALSVSGVWTYVDDGVLNPNTIAIVPGATIQVGANGGARGPSLQGLDRPGDIGLGMELNENLTMQIKKHLLDDSLPPETAAVRSATEIIQRIKDLARDIGSPFGRMYSELIVPVLQNTLDIMADAGYLKGELKINGLGVRVVVTSPLAIEQNINDVDQAVRWLSILAQFGPEAVTMAAKIEEIGAWMGEKLGVPADLIRTEKERAAMKAAFAKKAANDLGVEPGTKDIVPIVNLPSGGGAMDQMPMAA